MAEVSATTVVGVFGDVYLLNADNTLSRLESGDEINVGSFIYSTGNSFVTVSYEGESSFISLTNETLEYSKVEFEQLFPSAVQQPITDPQDPNEVVADIYTNQNVISLTFNNEQNFFWEYSLDRGVTWQRGEGTSFVFPDGFYEADTIRVRETNIDSGLQSPVRNISPKNSNGEFLSFVIDTQEPNAPELTLVEDTSIADDGVSKNGLISIEGLEPHATWEYRIDGSNWIAGEGSSFLLTDGTYAANSIEIRQTDRAGNTSNVGLNAESWTIDTVQPPLAEVAQDNNVLTVDLPADDDAISTTVTYLDGTGTPVTIEFVRDAEGNWVVSGDLPESASFDPVTNQLSVLNNDLQRDANQLVSVTEDLAGNRSVDAKEIEFLPPAPPELVLLFDSGALNRDEYTNEGRIVVLGLEEGGTWEYSLNNGTDWVQGEGNIIDIANNTLLPIESRNVLVRQVNANGVSESTLIDYTLDAVAPNTPVITNYDDSTISGVAESLSFVTVYFQSGVVETIQADASGRWSFNVDDSSLAYVRSTDLAGNESDLVKSLKNADGVADLNDIVEGGIDQYNEQTPVSVTVDPTSSFDILIQNTLTGVGEPGQLAVWLDELGNILYAAPTDENGNFSIPVFADQVPDSGIYDVRLVNEIVDPPAPPSVMLQNDTGSSDADLVTNDGRLVVKDLVTGADWSYSLDGGTTWVQGTGDSIDLTDAGDKQYSVIVKQENQFGESDPSAAFNFQLDTTAPSAPEVTKFDDDGSPIQGTAESRSFVTVSFEDGTSTTVQAGFDGSWTVNNPGVGPSVSVTAEDLAGNTSPQTSASEQTNRAISISGDGDADGSRNFVYTNKAAGTRVGVTAQAEDLDGDAITYSLINNANGLFTINSQTGVVTLARTSTRFDVRQHSITVKAESADGTSVEKDYSISLENPIYRDGTVLSGGGAHFNNSGTGAGQSWSRSFKVAAGENYSVQTSWTAQYQNPYKFTFFGHNKWYVPEWDVTHGGRVEVLNQFGRVVASRDFSLKMGNNTHINFNFTAQDEGFYTFRASNPWIHGNAHSTDLNFDRVTIYGANPNQLITPLALDLDGDGVTTMSSEEGVMFDIAGIGQAQKTGWIGGGDGLLVRDIDGSGAIEDGSELFGEATVLEDGTRAKDGFEALADIDSNKDGVITAEDDAWNELLIWVDKNGDGVSQADELYTLEEHGVASLSLNHVADTTVEEGNAIIAKSTWTDADGNVHDLVDVAFGVDVNDETEEDNSVIQDDDLTDEVADELANQMQDEEEESIDELLDELVEEGSDDADADADAEADTEAEAETDDSDQSVAGDQEEDVLSEPYADSTMPEDYANEINEALLKTNTVD